MDGPLGADHLHQRVQAVQLERGWVDRFRMDFGHISVLRDAEDAALNLPDGRLCKRYDFFNGFL